MATENEDMAEMIYPDRPISRAILRAMCNSPMTLSQVVSRTGYPREEVATWLLDMETKGLLSYSIELPTDKAEAVFSLAPKARTLLHQLGSNLTSDE